MKSGTDHVFDMTPDEYCQQKAAASGSSFYYSFLFLSPKRRRAITALYAFCREVDDVVDETSDPQVAGAKLAWWRAEIANLAAGKAQHPVSLALAPFVEKFGIAAARLNEIIDGMEMDLTQTRYLDWRALEHYCYHVAGVVGLLAAGIFGYRDARTLRSEEHTSELQSRLHLVCRLLLEKKKKYTYPTIRRRLHAGCYEKRDDADTVPDYPGPTIRLSSCSELHRAVLRVRS